MSDTVDVVVVGAGVVGLACARRFASEGYETLVLESESAFGTGVSARSSEVIHAGIYYPEGSLKAKLCLEGREALYRYCESRRVPHRQIGKWIVATDSAQLAELGSLRCRAHRNGCQEVEWVDLPELQREAPDLRCVGALFSPRTGIVDSYGFMQSLVAEIESFGGVLAYRCAVGAVASRPTGGFTVRLVDQADSAIDARILINAAGLDAPNLAARIVGLSTPIPAAAYVKGSYFSYSGRVPFSRLVYPVPEKAGLGVHLTFTLDGHGRFGPDVEWIDAPNYSVDLNRREFFADSIRRYWPNVDPDRLQPAYAGVRPKLGSRDAFETDFMIQDESVHGVPRLWNLLGIESPGLTASLALAEYVFSTHRKLE